jgi:hypothetical protein
MGFGSGSNHCRSPLVVPRITRLGFASFVQLDQRGQRLGQLSGVAQGHLGVVGHGSRLARSIASARSYDSWAISESSNEAV